MQSNEKSLYILPTDESERTRLGDQHQVLTKTFGVIYAPIKLRAGDNVLDNGTGSGSWLLECYGVHKDVKFHGIDLKSDIFPRLDEHQQRQILLSKGNILHLPTEWTGKFQLVNQRLLIAGLSNENWKRALEQIYRVLAPGSGWVQLAEVSHFESGESTRVHYEMWEELYDKRGLVVKCVAHISKMLRDVGFERVEAQRHEIPMGGHENAMNVKARESFFGVFPLMKDLAVTMGVRTGEEFDEILANCKRELENDAQAKAIFYTFVARKPSRVYPKYKALL